MKRSPCAQPTLRSAAFLSSLLFLAGQSLASWPEDDLAVPSVGYREMRVLTPTMIELFVVNTQGPGKNDRPTSWDWVDDTGALRSSFPQAEDIHVTVDGHRAAVSAIGFRRYPLYAPLPSKTLGQSRDLRIGNSLFIQLVQPMPEGAKIAVTGPGNDAWPALLDFSATMNADRPNPALHINQAGYEPGWPKRAQVGYFCGTLGELLVAAKKFEIIRRSDRQTAYSGDLERRRDLGFTISPAPYQEVFDADFSKLTAPGEYILRVPGMGVSYPFRIGEGVSGALARTLVLGIFHQRDGRNRQELPWTRFIDGPAHLRPAEILTEAPEFAKAWGFVAGMSTPPKEQTAPALRDPASQLYPPVKQGAVDVSGGHRDAGDYSKYTINTAGTVAVLIFAVDNLTGVRELDNLGIPESGDGVSDVLQEAKYEADFLARMQDADGGFWFLVYPKSRPYEDNVLPTAGDAQVLFPKNTSATAAAVGALAQAGSSPAMRAAFPDAAALYRQKAEAGWAFLERAIAAHGKAGAYQKVTHYGDVFTHDDELAFAAAAMFAMTGDAKFQAKLEEWCPNPSAPSLRRWSFWHLFECYGHAFRAYAFAVRSGRLSAGQLDGAYLAKVNAEILAAGEAAAKSSRECAYGSSYDEAFKRPLNAGYHFSPSIAFDLAVAAELASTPAQRDAFRDAAVANLGYTLGSNPVNVCFVTGLGWKRFRNAVSQFAQNDERVLPPTGLPVGEISDLPYSFAPYRTSDGQNLLVRLIYPAGGKAYPIYDRFADSFNVSNEATIIDQARAAATALWLFAATPLRSQKWQAPPAEIVADTATAEAGRPITVRLVAPGCDLTGARIVWEAKGQQPAIGPTRTFTPPASIPTWIETEADFPDGRRIFARRELAPAH